MQVDERLLSDFLFDSGALSRRDLERALQLADERGAPLAETLVHAGMLRDDQVRRALAHVLGIPFVVLPKGSLALEALVLLPESLSRAKNAIAFAQSGEGIEVAFLSMDDAAAVREHLGNRRILPRLTDQESITHALLHYQKHLKELFGAALSREMAQIQMAETAQDARANMDAGVRATDALLSHALHQRAKELYLEPGQGNLRVRYRAGAELYDAMTLPLNALPLFTSRLKSLASIPLGEMGHGAGRFKISPDGFEQIVVTVTTAPVMREHGQTEKLALSFARETSEGAHTLSSLGFSEKNASLLRRALSKKEGLVLVCGQPGNGVTTTLYALLGELAGQHVRIATIEQRVTTVLPFATQTELNEKIGLTAAACVRAELRHAPDILMIDCALDEESARLAVEAANRGTLVFAGVESYSAAEGVASVASLGISADLLASVCIASIGTALIPKLCEKSKKARRLSRDEQNILEERINIKDVFAELKSEQVVEPNALWKDVPLFSASACAECEHGYAGYVGLQEVISSTLTLKDAIRGDADAATLGQQARNEGAFSFAEDALIKAAEGLVSIEMLLEVAGA